MKNGIQHDITHRSQPHTAAATGGGRSSIERLPPAVREVVATAVTDGATIDEIVALIRAHGIECSRSAVGRHAKQMRDRMRAQREIDQGTEAWVDSRGERAEGGSGFAAIDALRDQVLATLAALGKRESPATTEEIAGLALALRRIEGADSLRAGREREAAAAAARAALAARPKGLSQETADAIRRAVLGEDYA